MLVPGFSVTGKGSKRKRANETQPRPKESACPGRGVGEGVEMTITIKEPEINIHQHIVPALKADGHRVRFVEGEDDDSYYLVNRYTEMRDEFSFVDIILRGPDAVLIAQAIERKFPHLNITAEQTEAPRGLGKWEGLLFG
jgi:hypothetical protein